MKLNPKVFRKAAEIVIKKYNYDDNNWDHYERYEGACIAIEYTCKKEEILDKKYLEFFKELFYLDATYYSSTHDYWFGLLNKKQAKIRANALLLCAEMCADE